MPSEHGTTSCSAVVDWHEINKSNTIFGKVPAFNTMGIAGVPKSSLLLYMTVVARLQFQLPMRLV